MTLTGFYLWNKSDEPCTNYFSTGSGFDGSDRSNRFADPGDYLLKRRPWVLALNNAMGAEQHDGARPALQQRPTSRTTTSSRRTSTRDARLLADLPWNRITVKDPERPACAA